MASMRAGVSMVAPGDGVSAAEAAVRTLHVAAQYIQYRKEREQEPAPQRGEERLPSQHDRPLQALKQSRVVLSNIVPTTLP
jgi:hypothetical protein